MIDSAVQYHGACAFLRNSTKLNTIRCGEVNVKHVSYNTLRQPLSLVQLAAPDVHPRDKKLTLSRNMTKLRRAGHELRLRYARFVVELEAT
jgi:hypothetical protein